MARKPTSNGGETQFVVDLGQIELTDEEVTAVQNEITKVALDVARKKKTTSAVSREPYVKVLHVRTTHVRSIRK